MRRIIRRNTRSAISFREFVRFLLDPNSIGIADLHWRPMHLQCSPCRFRYDFIGHYETLLSDVEYVTRKLGIPDKLAKFPYENKKPRRSAADRTANMMKQLTSEQVDKLRQIYKMDFELFGYH